MTRDEAKQLLPVIQAWAEGKEIQFKPNNNPDASWKDVTEIEGVYNYRIKPNQPYYRPFKNLEECWAEMQKHQPFGWVKDEDGYINLGYVDNSGFAGNTFEGALEHLNFADGQPFGILEEEV